MSQTTGAGERLAVGAIAPDFTLPSTSGESVTLSRWRGEKHVLLAFFPLAFTTVCTSEMSGFHEDLDRFEHAGVQVYGISVDSVPSLTVFQTRAGMRTEMLSDFKREVSRLYGVLNEERFTARRSYFLIDRSGVLRWMHVEEHNGLKRDNDELLAEIAKLP